MILLAQSSGYIATPNGVVIWTPDGGYSAGPQGTSVWNPEGGYLTGPNSFGTWTGSPPPSVYVPIPGGEPIIIYQGGPPDDEGE